MTPWDVIVWTASACASIAMYVATFLLFASVGVNMYRRMTGIAAPRVKELSADSAELAETKRALTAEREFFVRESEKAKLRDGQGFAPLPSLESVSGDGRPRRDPKRALLEALRAVTEGDVLDIRRDPQHARDWAAKFNRDRGLGRVGGIVIPHGESDDLRAPSPARLNEIQEELLAAISGPASTSPSGPGIELPGGWREIPPGVKGHFEQWAEERKQIEALLNEPKTWRRELS